MRCFTTLAAAMVVGSALPVGAQSLREETRKDGEAGERIVITAEKAELRDGEKAIATIPRGNVLRVDEVRGDQIFVIWSGGNGGARQGWLPAAQTMPSDKALPFLNEEVRKAPTAENFTARGMVLFEKNDFEAAIVDLDKAIELSPRFTDAYVNRGIARKEKGKLEEAVADFNIAIVLDPGNAAAYANRGIIWLNCDQADSAIADLDRSIRLGAKESISFLCRGLAHLAKDHYFLAVQDLNQAIDLKTKDPIAYTTLARICTECPDPDLRNSRRAVELATKGCELSEWKDANALHVLAAAHAEEGDFENAAKQEAKAVELGTEEEKPLFARRLFHYESGVKSR